MKSNVLVSAIVAVSLATSGLAFGQGRGGGNDRGRNEHAQRGDRHDRHDEGRRPDRREYQGRGDERREGRGAGPNHEFYRGDRLPLEYRHRHYVVEDWRGYHLSAPPRGYHWVQVGGDYILVAIATGVILQLLLNH